MSGLAGADSSGVRVAQHGSQKVQAWAGWHAGGRLTEGASDLWVLGEGGCAQACCCRQLQAQLCHMWWHSALSECAASTGEAQPCAIPAAFPQQERCRGTAITKAAAGHAEKVRERQTCGRSQLARRRLGGGRL